MERVDRLQRYSAALHGVAPEASSRFSSALNLAGWSGVEAVPNADAAMVISAGTDTALAACPTSVRPVIRAIIGDDAAADMAGADLVISEAMDIEALAALFRQWLPPDTIHLARMADAFGRASLVPLVEGLQAALRDAIGALDRRAWVDAHKLAGLSGTLGFAAASACWRAVDHGENDPGTARRCSLTALIAIDRWLRDND